MNEATLEMLGKRAQRTHMTPRTLAQRHVEEGLRSYRRRTDAGAIVKALEAKLAELPADDALLDGESWL